MLQSFNTAPRLYVKSPLLLGKHSLVKEACHYVATVLRKREGDFIRLFHDASGEFLGTLVEVKKHHVVVEVESQLRPPETPEGPTLLFSPLKHDAVLFLLEKAAELGVYALQPVLCERTVVRHFSEEKAQKRLIEAVEQSERLWVPHVYPLKPLKTVLREFDDSLTLWGALERDEGSFFPCGLKLGVSPFFLVGPEGGFTETEKNYLRSLPFFKSLSLGKSILRAETAAIALLSFCHIQKISS